MEAVFSFAGEKSNRGEERHQQVGDNTGFSNGATPQQIGNALATGIYAFLPTDMVTGFSFIIQGDFLLVSSRESIILNNKWNLGILNCIPSAFYSSFISLLHCDESTLPISSSNFFKYLPVNTPSCREIRLVRDSIQSQLKEEEIIFSETHNTYCMPK